MRNDFMWRVGSVRISPSSAAPYSVWLVEVEGRREWRNAADFWLWLVKGAS